MASAAPAHFKALDGLRGLAVILVLFNHAQHYEFLHKSFLIQCIGLFFNACWVGVDIFFALSGFLITGILLDTLADPHYFSNFYLRRMLRILPLYYAVLVLVGLLSLIFNIDWHGSAPCYILLVENYCNYSHLFLTGPNLSLHIEHLWSVAVEEQFYVVWPFLVWALKPRRYLVLATLLMLVLCPIARSHFSTWDDRALRYLWTPFIADLFASGCLAAIIARSVAPQLRERWATLILLLSVTIIVYVLVVRHGYFDKDDPFVAKFGFSAIAWFSSSLILLLLNPGRWISRLFAVAPLRWFGRLSYGIYIFHYVFAESFQSARAWVISVTHNEALGALSVFVLTFVVGTGLAWISYNCYEKYWLRLKSRFPRSPGLRGENIVSAS